MAPPPLPNSTPQAFSAYLNTYFHGDGDTLGAPVAALHLPGTSLGEQWNAWYAAKHAAYGNTVTLLGYEQAFIVAWEAAMLGTDLSGAAGTGAGAVGTEVGGIFPGLNQFNQDLGGAPAAAANAYSAATSWTQSLGSFFGALGQPATWIRVTEVVVGVVLLAAALNALLKKATGTDVIGSAGKAARAVA